MNIKDIILPNITTSDIESILFVAKNQKLLKDQYGFSICEFCHSYQENDLRLILSIMKNKHQPSIIQYPRFANYDIERLKLTEPKDGCDKYEFGHNSFESLKTIEKIKSCYKVFDKISIYVSSNIITSKFGKILYDCLCKYGNQVTHSYYKVFYFDSIEKCQEAQSILFNIIKSDFEAPIYIWSTIKKLESIIKYLGKNNID